MPLKNSSLIDTRNVTLKNLSTHFCLKRGPCLARRLSYLGSTSGNGMAEAQVNCMLNVFSYPPNNAKLVVKSCFTVFQYQHIQPDRFGYRRYEPLSAADTTGALIATPSPRRLSLVGLILPLSLGFRMNGTQQPENFDTVCKEPFFGPSKWLSCLLWNVALAV